MSVWARVARLAVVAVVAWALCPAGAHAQAAARPFRGLFGSGMTGPDRAQSLTLTLGGYGGYDDSVLGRQPQAGIDPALQSGTLAGAQAGLGYNLTRGNFTARWNLGTSMRYYPDQSDTALNGYTGSLGMSYSGSRNSLNLVANASYAPRFRFQLLGDESAGLPPVVPDATPIGGADGLAVNDAKSLRGGVALDYERKLSTRSSIGLSAGHHRSSAQTGEGRDIQDTTAGLSYRYQWSKILSVHADYGYRWLDYTRSGDARLIQNQSIGLGIDLNRSFSLTRTTTVGFNTSSTILSRERARAESEGTARRIFRVNGSASLQQMFGRSWTGVLAANRYVQVIDEISEPILADRFSLSLAGAVSRRLTVTASAGYSIGKRAFSKSNRQFDVASATVNAQYALTSWVGTYVQLLSYRYIADPHPDVPRGTPGDVSRQGVRVGVSVLVPLLR